MIAVIVLLALCFAWAVIATAVAIAQTKLRETAEVQGLGWKTVYELERDRAQASSLSEFRAWNPVAMEPDAPEEPKQYAYDATGLIRTEVDTRDDAE